MSPSAKRPTRRSVPGPALSGPHHPNPLQGNSNFFQQNLLCVNALHCVENATKL